MIYTASFLAGGPAGRSAAIGAAQIPHAVHFRVIGVGDHVRVGTHQVATQRRPVGGIEGRRQKICIAVEGCMLLDGGVQTAAAPP